MSARRPYRQIPIERYDSMIRMEQATNGLAPEDVAKLLAIGAVMWEANGDMGRFADPTCFDPDVVRQINALLAYIITVQP